MSLKRWFKEKWVDVKTGKPCGRQKGEKRKGYPACRPSRRVSSKTPRLLKRCLAVKKQDLENPKQVHVELTTTTNEEKNETTYFNTFVCKSSICTPTCS